jgi:RNA polymerase sigma factor (sigma-70 family)
MEDAELVRQAAAGRAAAYGQLARRHAPRVLALCHARTARADVAEDLAQEALLRGWRGIRALREPAKFAHWLCGISRRVCLDWVNAAPRREVPLSALGNGEAGGEARPAREPSARDAAAAAERRDDLERLVAEVERLPAEYREALMMFYYQDCSYQEIADALGVSAATVNARMTKARKLLRERMSRGRPDPRPATGTGTEPVAGTGTTTPGTMATTTATGRTSGVPRVEQ